MLQPQDHERIRAEADEVEAPPGLDVLIESRGGDDEGVSVSLERAFERVEDARVRAEMMELLSTIGLADYAELPAAELSIGQRRLLSLGRAMAMRPTLLLLDEPAAGLSPVNVDNLLKIVMALKDRYGLTVVIIEHILRVVMEVCDRITVLDQGQKIGEGTPDEVKEDPAVVEAYLGRQMDDAEVRAAIGSRAARRRRRDRSDAVRKEGTG